MEFSKKLGSAPKRHSLESYANMFGRALRKIAAPVARRYPALLLDTKPLSFAPKSSMLTLIALWSCGLYGSACTLVESDSKNS